MDMFSSTIPFDYQVTLASGHVISSPGGFDVVDSTSPSLLPIQIDAVKVPDYIDWAMHCAQYTRNGDDTFFGEIPGFQGVWSCGDSEASATEELECVLREWVSLRLERGLSLPAVVEPEPVA